MAFTTRKSLLAKVHSGDACSWDDFYKAYKPLILLKGDDLGLKQDEKQELIQNVMFEVFAKDITGKFVQDKIPDDVVFTYDPSKGRFRHYLRKVVKFQAIKILKKRRNNVSLNADDDMENFFPADDVWNASWDEEWHRHVLNQAMVELKNRVQPETFAAFEMYAVQNRNVQEVAEFLNLSVSSVYTAKSRCVSALREIIKDLEDK
ncbi:MAG: sigma-70 family RNA polymerase sigma factor [Lentisphaerae bacterium]|nr:sigma-70 family RNA polymerase sigma factor [Lentisphaerota bacterium]